MSHKWKVIRRKPSTEKEEKTLKFVRSVVNASSLNQSAAPAVENGASSSTSQISKGASCLAQDENRLDPKMPEA